LFDARCQPASCIPTLIATGHLPCYHLAVLAIAIILLVLAVIFTSLLVNEVRRYKSGRHLISPRRLALRLIAGFLLLILLGMVFSGLFVLQLKEAGARPQLFITFWSVCLLIAVALIVVMLMDLREVGERYLQRQNEMWHDFAAYLAKHPARPEITPHDEPKQ
jgi:uncharacterized membrane protein